MKDHIGILTKRENASLNSETCSSVRESACRDNKLVHTFETRAPVTPLIPTAG